MVRDVVLSMALMVLAMADVILEVTTISDDLQIDKSNRRQIGDKHLIQLPPKSIRSGSKMNQPHARVCVFVCVCVHVCVCVCV